MYETLLEYAFLTYIKAATNQLHVVLHNNLESYIAQKKKIGTLLSLLLQIYEYLIRQLKYSYKPILFVQKIVKFIFYLFWILITKNNEISEKMCILFRMYDVKMHGRAQYSLVICTSYIYQIAQLITMLYFLSCGTRTFFLCTLSFSFYTPFKPT